MTLLGFLIDKSKDTDCLVLEVSRLILTNFIKSGSLKENYI